MRIPATLAIASLLLPSLAQAKEYPIGEPQQCGGMEVAAVYLQPVEMEPAGMMLDAANSDVHLEADIAATEGNRNGWQEGSFVSYLNIRYSLSKQGSDEKIEGDFHPMVANDGPHYGDNVKLMGPGKYQLTFTVSPPDGKHATFGRHVDKETGVAPWFEPCTLNYAFTYAGIGKKGGY
ncbi:iron transporter [Stutzerimonas stutzeri]|uniref:iron transporter n=1 Tax=Stutzerimonas stutzeri TaxID=316 RepID=UPI00210ED7F8|nr:iron transporter [Stutzerimonas stutzeri]MCQ4320729.1 iron transporter [Stutzerimonas stutzeri]